MPIIIRGNAVIDLYLIYFHSHANAQAASFKSFKKYFSSVRPIVEKYLDF